MKDKNNINFGQYEFKDFSKEDLFNTLFNDFLIKLFDIFEWKNLPENITQRNIELNLMKFGYTTFLKLNEKFYCTFCSMIPPLDYEYLGTKVILTNPYIENTTSKEFTINKDCVIIKNNELFKSDFSTIHNYILQVVEIITSIRLNSITSRLPFILDTDTDQNSFDNKEFTKKILDGEMIGILTRNTFLDGIHSNPYGSQHVYYKESLEVIQYFLSKLYNEYGIQSNFNMKRESLNKNEINANNDLLIPRISQMLRCRKEAVKKINELYNLNIEVNLSSIWLKNNKLEKIDLKIMESEVKENDV